MKAQKQLTDDEIIESLPKVCPCRQYLVNKDTLSGVGRFPVDRWIADNKPMLDGAGWIAPAMKIAAKDLDALGARKSPRQSFFGFGRDWKCGERAPRDGHFAGCAVRCVSFASVHTRICCVRRA